MVRSKHCIVLVIVPLMVSPMERRVTRSMTRSLQCQQLPRLQSVVELPTCAICLEDFNKSLTVTLECHHAHMFHKSCLDQWLKNHATCPAEGCHKPAIIVEDQKEISQKSSVIQFLRKKSHYIAIAATVAFAGTYMNSMADVIQHSPVMQERNFSVHSGTANILSYTPQETLRGCGECFQSGFSTLFS